MFHVERRTSQAGGSKHACRVHFHPSKADSDHVNFRSITVARYLGALCGFCIIRVHHGARIVFRGLWTTHCGKEVPAFEDAVLVLTSSMFSTNFLSDAEMAFRCLHVESIVYVFGKIAT